MAAGAGRPPRSPAAPGAELLTGLRALVDGNLATIRTEFGRFTRQVSGYSLEHLLPENGADVAKFLSGTEGTLALTLRATVRLVAAPRATALAVLGYPDMASAAEAVPGLLPHLPVALEGLDSRMVNVVRTRRGPAAVPGLPRGGGWLFAETAGDTLDEARAAASKLVADGGCLDSAVITGPAAAALWRIREDGAGLSGRTPAGAPAWPGWEDSAVPPASLPAYLRELEALMAAHGVDGLLYGHFGDGCIHARIDFPLRDRPSVLRSFTQDAARLAASYGGSASGEHGDGRARGELLPAMYSATAIGLFGAVKQLFDPANLLNPGVIVDPAPLDADLRVPLAAPLRRGLGFAYAADGGDFTSAVHRCTGVGKCRADNTASGGVMCPSYLATRDEKDSTRGRARVLQELANGSLVSSGWQSPEVAEALDLCLSCKGCSTDCPAGVDMATYKAEALYQRYRGRLRPASHYALGWLPRWAALTSRRPWTARLANAALRFGPAAAAAKRLGGIDERRDLPVFATQSFRRWFAERPVTSAPPARQARAAVGGHVHQRLRAAGRPGRGRGPRGGRRTRSPSPGATSAAASPGSRPASWTGPGGSSRGRSTNSARPSTRASRSSGSSRPAPPRSAPTRPNCCPTTPGPRRSTTAVKTLAELLTATDGWTPPDLSDVTAVAQPHCHQHAVLGWDADKGLLRERGREGHRGRRLLRPGGQLRRRARPLRRVRRRRRDRPAPGRPEGPRGRGQAGRSGPTVLADGFSCRTQLDQLADVHGRHLAELLADRLRRRPERASRAPPRRPGASSGCR